MTTEMIDAGTGELTTTTARDAAVMPGFGSQSGWELANRIGKAFAASSLVPAQYQGNVANCIVALEMANRMGASPLMVMQNLYIVHGNPGWSSKFLIACFNQCGRFSALRYEFTQDRNGCRAWATEKATGERIDGPQVTIEMARAEGWSTKAGSKWKTMPELMLMYRAAAFMIRTYAPEISMGLRTDDEIIDMGPADVVQPSKPTLPDYSAADFTKNLPAWSKVVEGGKKTGAELLAMLSTKATFSEQQKATILSLKAQPVEPVEAAAPEVDAETGEFAEAYEAAEGSQQ